MGSCHGFHASRATEQNKHAKDMVKDHIKNKGTKEKVIPKGGATGDANLATSFRAVGAMTPLVAG
jgi:hypothetical protein